MATSIVDSPAPQESSAAASRHQAYYSAFTARNRGLVSDEDQQSLRDAKILIAGCGSIGGAVVEPLVRMGAEHLVLVEPDVYELHNLNRQHARQADVGRNKATVLQEWVTQVNPHARVQVDTDGITAQNATGWVCGAQLVIDGIDVTSEAALVCKYQLHQAAKRSGVPVVSGYDIAGVQLVLVSDYRNGRVPVLSRRIDEQTLPHLTPLQFLARVVPLRALPLEIFPVLRGQLQEQGKPFPQLVYSARMFGVLAARLSLDLLAGRPVRRRIVVDVNTLTRPAVARWRTAVVRMTELARMAPVAFAYRH